jgi:hypothetical protein
MPEVVVASRSCIYFSQVSRRSTRECTCLAESLITFASLQAGLVEELCGLLRATKSKEAQYTAAGGIFNLAEDEDDVYMIRKYGVLDKLRSLPVSTPKGLGFRV